MSAQQFKLAREQSQQTEKALQQTEKALQSNTAATIYQEDSEVWQRVTPDIYPYFNGAPTPRDDDTRVARRAWIVAGAMLDHFEHVRFQIANGAMAADRDSWDAYIIETFSNSPLLCRQFEQTKAFYGGGGLGTIGAWAEKGCRRP